MDYDALAKQFGAIDTNANVDAPKATSLDELAKKFGGTFQETKVEKPKPQGGILGAAKQGAESFVSSLRTGAGAMTGNANEAATSGIQRQEDIANRYVPNSGMDEVKKAYNEKGILSAAGEFISQVPKAIAGQSANLGAMAAGAAAGSVFGPFGAVIGAAIPSFVQFVGTNLERQAQEQIKSGQGVDVNTGKAMLAAIPQTALDVVETRMLLGSKALSGALGISEKSLAKMSTEAVEKAATEKLLPILLKGTAKGVALEIPSEVSQQILERAQAGLSLTSPDAIQEYGDTMYQVSQLGPLGAVGKLSDRSQARGELAKRTDTLEVDAQKAERQRIENETIPEGQPKVEPIPEVTPLKVDAEGNLERDLFGVVPSQQAPDTKQMVGPDREEVAPAGAGTQAELEMPGQQELFTGTAPIQPPTTQTAAPTAKAPEPISIPTVITDTMKAAKTDPDAAKILKGNNQATANIVSSRVESFMQTPDTDPIVAMEQAYQQNATGTYPKGTKALSEPQKALLEAAYYAQTGQEIQDGIKDRAFREQSKQADLFSEGEQDGRGEATTISGTNGTDVGSTGTEQESGIGTGTTVGTPGVEGVGVDGGGNGLGKSTVGTGTIPAPLIDPEKVWNNQRNDDHPEYNQLDATEKEAWNNAVKANRSGAVGFRKVLDDYRQRTNIVDDADVKANRAILEKYNIQLRENIAAQVGGKRFSSVLRFLMNNGPEANQAIMKQAYKRYQDMLKAGYKFTFAVVNTKGYAGYLDPYSTPGTMKVRLSKQEGLTYRVASHEAIHAVAFSLINYGKNNPTTNEGKIVAQLGELQKYIVNYLQEKQAKSPNSLTYFEKQILASRAASAGMQRDNALGLRDKRTNVLMHEMDELMTWGLTDGRMLSSLDSIPYKNTNVAQKFVELIRNLLGISPRYDTAFNQLLRLTHELMETPSNGIILLQSEKNTPPSVPQATSVAPPGPSVVPQPGQKYILPTISKVQPAPTPGNVMRGVAKKIVDNVNNDSFWTSVRIGWVDQYAGLSKTLRSLPVFQDGQLRADMLLRSFSQVINLIKNGVQTGIPEINANGNVIIRQDAVNNLANAQLIADKLDTNPIVKGSGLSGRQYTAEIARILRGSEVMQEDADVRAKASSMMAQATQKMQEAKRSHKAGKSLTEVSKLVGQARAIRAKWREAVTLNREKQVTQAHITWAEQQLKAVPEAQAVLDIWRNTNLGLINLSEQAGTISKETADRYRTKKYYVPLFASRVDLKPDEQESFTGAKGGAKSVAKQYKLEGSDKQRNIWENMDKHYASTTASAFQNHTRKVAAEQLEILGAAKAVKHANNDNVNLRYKDFSHPLADENGIVGVIVDNPNDVAAFQMMYYELNPLMQGFSKVTQLLRATALINPMFWLKQLVRDPIHATLVANSGIVTPFHSAKEFINILSNNSEEARILARAGVIGQYDSTVDIHSFLKQSGTEKMKPSMLDKAMHKVMQIHESSDAATRVSIYKIAYKDGISQGMSKEVAQDYAIFKTRESINFSVRGNSSTLNALRHMIPFFSAAVTSMDTLYRAATGYGLNSKEKAEAQRLFYSRAFMLSLGTTVYAMMMQDDEDYKKLPDNVKDNNWLIPSPFGSTHSFIKVPIPFEIGFFFKTIPEAAVRYMAGTSTGEEVLKSYVQGIKQNLPGEGVLIPQAVKPALEVVTNYSFFKHRPVESIGDQGLKVSERGGSASETAKGLSKAGLDTVGLSPAKIDYLIQGYTSQMGTFVTGITDTLINSTSGKTPSTKNIEEQPFFKSFLTNPNTSKAASDFYEISHAAQETVNSFNRMKTRSSREDVMEFVNEGDNKKMMGIAPTMRRIGDNMAKIRNSIKTIEANEKIDPDVRRDKINQLQEQYDRVAKMGYVALQRAGIER